MPTKTMLPTGAALPTAAPLPGWAWAGPGLGLGWAWAGPGLGLGWAWPGLGLGSAWAGPELGRGWAWAEPGIGLGLPASSSSPYAKTSGFTPRAEPRVKTFKSTKNRRKSVRMRQKNNKKHTKLTQFLSTIKANYFYATAVRRPPSRASSSRKACEEA